MILDMQQTIWYVALGLLGGSTYVLVEVAKTWRDLTTFSAVKRYILGGIVGFLYQIGHSEYNWPNNLMCFVSGYAGVHFVQALVRRYEERGS